MLLTDSFGQTAKIEIPENVKKIGISMSGGADSSMLCYLLAKKIKEKNLDIIIPHNLLDNLRNFQLLLNLII
jgi:tRNA(Ile)-lysidine synthase TilS/MesJ